MKVKGKNSRPAPKKANSDFKYELLGIGLITLASLGAASLFTAALGAVGSLLIRTMEIVAGESRYLIILLLGMAGFKLIVEKSRFRLTPRAVGFIILAVVFLTLAHMDIPRDDLFRYGLKGRGGGLVGASAVYASTGCFGMVGTYIILAALTLVSLAMITGYTLGQLGLLAALRAKKAGSRIWNLIFNFLTEETDRGEVWTVERPEVIVSGSEISVPEPGPVTPGAREKVPEPDPDPRSKKKPGRSDLEIPEIPVTSLADGRPYRLPPVSLLKAPEKAKGEVSEKDIADRTRTLEATLESFGISSKVSGISMGPAITRYEIQPPPGIKVSRIVGLADDIALNLAAPGVRIEAPIPGKAAVGIEVPNLEISPVSLRELIESKEFVNSRSKLAVALGKDIAGAPVVADLGKMPHLLVAGATGAGKSVCINTLIANILFKATPDEVKLLMVDPKMVELTTYNGVPHLISPVVTDAKKAAGTLRWAVKEMERRYELFASAVVRDIDRYNKLCDSHPEESGPLPFIVIIIDELADLMMVAPADVEDSICRLAQMARAAGIHLVIATQRPSVDVITGLIKANIPSRISFAVSSLVDSRTILDMGGAEKLLGRGDMLFFPVGAPKPVRVQGAYLSDQEVEALVTYLKEQAQPVYDDKVLTMPPAEAGSGYQDDDYDDLLSQAVKIFIESGTASISLLQRRLHVGYARAARLVDIMERRGIVGGFEGSKPRSIKMTLEQYQQTFGNQA